MEIIAKISKGSKMDQIYIPKIRVGGFGTGQYVLVKSLEENLGNESKQQKTEKEKLVFYNVKELEPVKIDIIKRIFKIIEKENNENVIITGSFLEKGFNFNDIDIIVLSNEKINSNNLKIEIEKATGIMAHVLIMNNKTLIAGLSSDPLYNLMISKSVSKKRVIFNVERKISYQLLDLNLLKSKTLMDNFSILTGKEKYYFTLNLVSILAFIKGKKLSKDIVNREIKKLFGVEVEEIKENLISASFLNKYKKIYNETFSLILKGVKNEQK